MEEGIMGDRFYFQQGQTEKLATTKPRRRVKKDIASDIQDLLMVQIPDLEKATKTTLEKLLKGIEQLCQK